MPTIFRYLLRHILTPFAMALTVLLLALSLERLLRIIQTITDQGASIGHAFEVLAYLVPHYLSLAVPAALFLAVLMGLRRLHDGSELTAILAAGVPLRRLLRPILGLAAVLTGLMLVNASFVQPHARYAYRATMHELSGAMLAFRLQPGVFHKINDRLVVRADDVSQGGRLLHRFFAEMQERDGTRTVMTARAGWVRVDPETGALTVELEDGTIMRAESRTLSGAIEFQRYTWRPPMEVPAPYGPRGQSERELTLPELFVGGIAGLSPDVTRAEIRAELHGRLVHVLSLPVLVVLAVPLALLGGGRAGRAYGLVLGTALLVLYQKIVGFGEAFVAEGAVPPWLGSWLPLAVLLMLAGLLLAHASEASGRSLIGWIARVPVGGRPARAEGVAE